MAPGQKDLARSIILSAKPKQKQKQKRRKRLTRPGQKKAKAVWSAINRGGQRSLQCGAKQLVHIYAMRMQTEESSRDVKSHRFDWDFGSARSWQLTWGGES
jgi:hypothetical protein